MQPPCGPTFVSVPIDDWSQPTQPLQARSVSRELGPDPDAMRALATAITKSKRPAFVVGPAVDRARAVDLMVQVVEKAKAPVWVSPFSSRCSFPERHSQFAGFLHASPDQLSDILCQYDLVSVIGAPVFTFHVEGVAEVFDGYPQIYQITDDPAAAAVTPSGTSIIATMKPALTKLLALLPENDWTACEGRTLPPPPRAADPIPVDFLLHTLSKLMPEDAALVEEAPSHRPLMHQYLPMRGQDSFYTMASGGLGYGLPASVGVALGQPQRRTVCLIGDGSAMYSIQALWTAAQRRLPLTVVVINNLGYGAMRSFSQVMQVRNVPGLDLPGIDFVQIAQAMGCDAVRVSNSAELAPALSRGLAHHGVSLIEVMVESAVPLLYAKK
jgi:benzoylformate decarboxylase